jgi:hypothetical protein
MISYRPVLAVLRVPANALIDGFPADDPSARQRRAAAMRRLPGVYSLALRLREAGLAGDLIAECLAMQPESLDPLLQVAEAKLAAILASELGG